MSTILLVEDDENLRIALADNLESEGYQVVQAASGAEARAGWTSQPPDVVILDIMLPDTDGYTLCRELRNTGSVARVLMLTARTLEEDLVRGFDAGADDYVQKPYRLAELLARVRALMRRRVATDRNVLRFGPFSLDVEGRTLKSDGDALVELTPKEFDLLAYLLKHQNRALPRQQILDDVWGVDVIVDGRTIDNFVSNLKRKLGWTTKSPFRIKTVRGVGYRMEILD